MFRRRRRSAGQSSGFSPFGQILYNIISNLEANNLTGDILQNAPASVNALASAMEELGVNELSSNQYLTQGSSALVFTINGNCVLKLAPPPQDTTVLSESHKSKDILLFPLEQARAAVSGMHADTAVEIYPRVLSLKEMTARLIISDPSFNQAGFFNQFQEYKRILYEAFIRENFFNSDPNDRNIGFLTDINGQPVQVTTSDGTKHFVPLFIDFEKITKIQPPYLANFAHIKNSPTPELVERWKEAVRTTMEEYRQAHPIARHHRSHPERPSDTPSIGRQEQGRKI